MCPESEMITGLIAATFTPLTPQGELNLAVIGQYVDYLLEKQRVRCVFVNGTTGEGCSLTLQERKQLAEEWCRQGKGRLDQVIVHVGCLSLKDSQELARHAASVGADAIAVISPSFFKPKNAEALQMFLKAVGEAAPQLPLYYYHLPSMTGLKLNVREVLEDIEKKVPSFRGLKFSGVDLSDLGQCVSYCRPRGWSVLYGVDEQLLGALALGVNGAVGSTYNYVGYFMNKMLSAFEKGDLTLARSLQFKLQDVLTFANGLGFDLAMNKQVMSVCSGLPMGPPRLPLLPSPPDAVQDVVKKLHQDMGTCPN
ncbi:N-acetylneuraminate lyase [Tachysurus fulvidraco]|uniref:N-acetylneuraminate lyase n=1 Tax=Tachysurus fulvidraco TaxID=1234273 RepID=UPI000F4E9220|nr:N-acetylneuraminate lyase [Tachysurus fulvidraco]XP_047655865.1 N-acetylneuraminate lyase [Tachysurus fulvidraco]XP_047655866.1 N-acetylneuraminate lyase [Tachysurus fulvidraco]XP_047655867.1 N-acetylneuraminate lyase [Tachysurus fulvidraco]